MTIVVPPSFAETLSQAESENFVDPNKKIQNASCIAIFIAIIIIYCYHHVLLSSFIAVIQVLLN